MAADVITRFKLETTQFDSKLRDTAKALQDIANTAQNAGKDFNDFSQKSIEAARSLGTVQSGATNTKDKLRDLVGSYNDAVKAYDKLSDAAKQGEFGKALAASLQKLQQDIKETKEELYSLNDATKGKGGGGLFGEGGLTGMLQVAGGNLISKGVGMLTSELTETVKQSVELAKQGEGIRLAFERLNKPGLLNNLKEATHGTVSELELMKAAVKFDDFKLPVEELGTLLAFAQKKAKDTGQSVDYMVDSIVTGLGRKSLMILDNLGLSAAQIKERMAEGGDMTKAVADIIKDQMAEAGEYVETAADRAARAAADAQNQMEALGREAMPVAEAWNEAWNTIKIGGMSLMNVVLVPLAESIRDIQNLLNNGFEDNIVNSPFNIEGKTPPKTGYQGMGDKQKVTAPGGYVEVTDKNTGEVLGGKHFENLNDSNSIKSWQKTLTKTPKSGSKSKTMKQSDLEKFINQSILGADDLKSSDAKDFLSPYQQMLPEIKKHILDIKDADLGGSLAMKGEREVKKEIQDINKSLEQQQKAYQMAGQAAQAFGAALQGIQDPAAKAAGTVVQAVASIALGFATASANANTAGTGWGWLAWLAAGASAMATTIATIHSLTGYAEGGIVKGNSYSGDNVPAMVGGAGGELVGLNAGEVVLTKAMQGSLARQLTSQGGGMQIVGELSGEKIVLVANRYFRRTGQGEIVTW